MQELRKQHWARELAAQKANESSRKSVLTSYPSLRGRRAASSSDCTLGYSSSEFETRSYRQLRKIHKALIIFHQSLVALSHHHHVTLIDMLRHPVEEVVFHQCVKWHSQESFHPSANYHVFSPPHVPGVYPRMIGDSFHYELPPPLTTQRRKWSDQESFDLESVVRSKVEEGSRASSAESSAKSETASVSSAGSSKPKSPLAQNPLVCPEVVTGRPTPRQDRILQNLSSLRQGLIKKQKELENLIRRPPPFYS
ncbi:CCDC66 domain-containing protein [Caerostris extrusa]|uniref:CCDC66 domain-containing protein n=1 Tax=Caerostris extrusa TaxID=172846 RepID=A0AAV4T4C4_CAEEX|nr:CCDC66 domain-containing protein [Caerostris extrusa]